MKNQLTPTEREIVEKKLDKAIRFADNSKLLMTIGSLSIFHGKEYHVVKTSDLMTGQQTALAYVGVKDGKMYRNSPKNTVDKKLALDLMECEISDILDFIFPIFNINFN